MASSWIITTGNMHVERRLGRLPLVQGSNTREVVTGRMARNIMLATDALGTSCPITPQRTGDTAHVLGVPPGRECGHAIARRYPATDARLSWSAGRKPPEEILHQEAFGP